MLLALLVLLTALTISAVAIYYSVVGLVAIFAAAAVPIMIMGGVLEVGKLVTAVWLHRYWKETVWWLKSYLSFAVVLLMFITSMGIFGFLSKAHIEQTSAGEESVAQVERINTEIARQDAIILRAEQQIQKAEDSTNIQDNTVQEQIDTEITRIDSAYIRVQPAINQQLALITSEEQKLETRVQPYKDQIDAIAATLLSLETYVNEGGRDNIKKAQGLIGAKADGSYGSRTAAAVQVFREGKNSERIELLNKIDELRGNESSTITAARGEILRQRGLAETEISNSNALISRLREQLGRVQDNSGDIDLIVDEQASRIKNANTELDTLTQEKYALESEYRKLEAEVGPIKYIAEFVYGEQADQNLLEQAVRWVILLIIIVFDPLAVLLLIASQYTFERLRKEKKVIKEELPWAEYEQKRAQVIVDNPEVPSEGANNNEHENGHNELGDEPSEETRREEATGFAGRIADEYAGNDSSTIEEDDRQPRAYSRTGDAGRMDATEQDYGLDNVSQEVLDHEFDDEFGDIEELNKDMPAPITSNMGIVLEAKPPLEEPQKKSLESSERLKELEAKEQDEAYQSAASEWKANNPDQTLKHYKNLYAKGVIDSLPWEQLDDADKYNTVNNEGYRQNSEQNDSTLFNKLKK